MAQTDISAVLNAVTENSTTDTITATATPSPAVITLTEQPTVFISNVTADYDNAKVKFNYLIVQYYNTNDLVSVTGTSDWIATTGLCSAQVPTVSATIASVISGTAINFSLVETIAYASCVSGVYSVVINVL